MELDLASYTDTLLILYEDLKIKENPFFLCYCHSGNILLFVINVLDKSTMAHSALTQSKHHTSYNYNRFLEMYNSEILDSFSAMKNFFKDFQTKPELNEWCHFCFIYTDLQEIVH